MKKLCFLGAACFIVVLLSVSVQAGPNKCNCVNPGLYGTSDETCDLLDDACDDYISTHMWKEKSPLGSHGALGNELMAVAKSFIFKDAVLVDVDGPKDMVLADGTTVFGYETTYEGATLVLNSSAPWLDCYKLVGTSITVRNKSWRDADGNLNFELDFEGDFENCDCGFAAIVKFDGASMPYKEVIDENGNLVFHSGRDFEVVIRIDCK